MSGGNYYLTTALPTLGELGSDAPLSLSALFELVAVAPRPAALVEAVLLGDDLAQRQAVMSGEIDQAEPIVLSVAQVRDEEPLPEALAVSETDSATARLPADAVWSAYFHYVVAVARQFDSEFLAAWVGYEVALRNALATARAKRLHLNASDYLVAEALGSTDERLDALVNEWASARDPLEALRVLDRARWDWLVRHDKWFTFGNDELAAYAAKLVLLHRWGRLTKADAQMADEAETTSQ